MKKNVIIKREGQVVKIKVPRRKLKEVKGVPVAEYIPRMRRVDKLRETLAMKAAVEAPTRSALNKRQWEQRGDLLRMVKGVGYEGADALSLAHLEDVVEGMRRCQMMRLAAQ